jgi:hypothetical protein
VAAFSTGTIAWRAALASLVSALEIDNSALAQKEVSHTRENVSILQKKNIIIYNMWNQDSIRICGPFLAKICQEIIV